MEGIEIISIATAGLSLIGLVVNEIMNHKRIKFLEKKVEYMDNRRREYAEDNYQLRAEITTLRRRGSPMMATSALNRETGEVVHELGRREGWFIDTSTYGIPASPNVEWVDRPTVGVTYGDLKQKQKKPVEKVDSFFS